MDNNKRKHKRRDLEKTLGSETFVVSIPLSRYSPCLEIILLGYSFSAEAIGNSCGVWEGGQKTWVWCGFCRPTRLGIS